MTYALVITLLLSSGAKDVVVYDQPFLDLHDCVVGREKAVAEVLESYDWQDTPLDASSVCARIFRRTIR